MCNAEALLKVQLFEGLPEKIHSMKVCNGRVFVFIFCIYIENKGKKSSKSDLPYLNWHL